MLLLLLGKRVFFFWCAVVAVAATGGTQTRQTDPTQVALRTWRCLLQTYDRDGSCTIDKDEFKRALRHAPPIVSSTVRQNYPSRKALFANFTSDGGETMDVAKLTERMLHSLPYYPAETVRSLYTKVANDMCNPHLVSLKTELCGV